MADPMKWICLLWQICVQCLMGKWVKKYGKVFVSKKPSFAVKTANYPRLGRQKGQFLSQEANQLTDLDNHMLYMETETLIGKSVTYNSVQNTFFKRLKLCTMCFSYAKIITKKSPQKTRGVIKRGNDETRKAKGVIKRGTNECPWISISEPFRMNIQAKPKQINYTIYRIKNNNIKNNKDKNTKM